MRGGAIPLIIWLSVFIISGAVDAVWTGDLFQIGMVLLATTLVGAVIGFIILASPESLKRGEPGPRGPQVVVRRSFAAFFTAIGFAVFVFGWTFGKFPIFVGAGMMIAGGGRLIGEWRAQQKAWRAR